MLKSIGIDIIKIRRIEEAISRWSDRFTSRVFTPAEISYCRSRARQGAHFAGRFAAKEAFKKAAGTGFKWTDIEIMNRADGKPYLTAGNKAGTGRTLLTISHSDEYAVAFVTVEEGEG